MIHQTKKFLILAENYQLDEDISKEVSLKKEMVGFVFYGSGTMAVQVSKGNKEEEYLKHTGMASSFFYSPEDVTINHKVSSRKAVNKLSLFIDPEALKKIVGEENEAIGNLLKPESPFVEGRPAYMNHDMYASIHKVMNCTFSGVTKDLLLESYATELLAHYLNNISEKEIVESKLTPDDIERLHYVKELILSQLNSPYKLDELSKHAGLNSFKLKHGFKALFGLPVYQYILHKRMELAFQAIQEKGKTVQEAAWLVGYSSLGSFSNAFYKKFGIRPSHLIR